MIEANFFYKAAFEVSAGPSGPTTLQFNSLQELKEYFKYTNVTIDDNKITKNNCIIGQWKFIKN